MQGGVFGSVLKCLRENESRSNLVQDHAVHSPVLLVILLTLIPCQGTKPERVANRI